METALPPLNPDVPPPSSLFGRMANVFAAPGDVFQEVKASPPCAANWLVPAVVLVLVGWLGAWLVFSQDSVKQQLNDITSKAIEKQIEKGKIPKEQAEAARQAGENRGAFSDSNLKRFAADIGLDQAAFDACLDSQRHADLVQAETAAGVRQGVRATPTLFVGGEKIEGSPTYERLRASIQRELSAPSPAPTRPGQ